MAEGREREREREKGVGRGEERERVGGREKTTKVGRKGNRAKGLDTLPLRSKVLRRGEENATRESAPGSSQGGQLCIGCETHTRAHIHKHTHTRAESEG